MSNTKTATDGVFDVDALIAEAQHKPFRFAFAGREWAMRHMADLDVWQMFDAAKRGDDGAVEEIFRLALGDEWGEFRSHFMPQHALQAIFERYQKHAGMEPGESRASSGS